MTLFNIVEAWFFFLQLYICVVWKYSDGSINSQEYESFEIDAVTVKISMTEYHHLMNRQTYGLI